MSNPIFVNSKARPEASVFGLLTAAGLNYAVIVEPQDAGNYEAAMQDHEWNGNPIVLPKADQGLSYARQFTLEFARKQNIDWYWLLDDDIRAFFETKGGKTVKLDTADAIARAEARFEQEPNLGIGSLEYQQFAWNAKRNQTAHNSYCDVAVFINPKVSANYRRLPLKSDRDFTLSVLASGRRTARLRDLSFSVPTNGSNAGGLHDTYKDGVEEQTSRELARLWPGIVEYKRKPNGRPDAKINWRFFNTQHEANTKP